MLEFLDKSFAEPLRRLMALLGDVLPSLFGVLTILVLGGAIAYLIRQVTYRFLNLVKFDRMVAGTALGTAIESARVFRSASDCGARLVQGFVWLFIILLALSASGTPLTEDLVSRFVAYVPDLITAALVLLLASAISKFLARSALLAAVNTQWPAARLIAGGVRVLVMSLGVVVALEQLRIGRTALLVAFAILFAGIVIAGAIAFGLGARDLVHEWLRAKSKPEPGEKEEILRHL